MVTLDRSDASAPEHEGWKPFGTAVSPPFEGFAIYYHIYRHHFGCSGVIRVSQELGWSASCGGIHNDSGTSQGSSRFTRITAGGPISFRPSRPCAWFER